MNRIVLPAVTAALLGLSAAGQFFLRSHRPESAPALTEGVLAAMGDQRLWLSNLPGKMVNTTGCGDAFMSALVWAYLQGSDLEQTALAGLAAGSIAMESGETINPLMSASALKSRMG